MVECNGKVPELKKSQSKMTLERERKKGKEEAEESVKTTGYLHMQ